MGPNISAPDLVAPTTPSDVPYALPVQAPSTITSPAVAADAPYTPAVLNLIAQLEPSNPPTEAELANASILFHGGTNTTCHNVGPTAAPTGTSPSIMAPCWTDAQGVNTFSGPNAEATTGPTTLMNLASSFDDQLANVWGQTEGTEARELTAVPAAVTVAGDLYWYTVTHVTGPVSAQASLDELLQSWKLPVPGLTQAQQRAAIASSLITAADDAMLTQKSVRLVITSSTGTAAAAQRIVADVGTVTGTEAITDGPATASIRVTSKAAYFTGTRQGLAAFIGLSPAAAARAGSRWVAIKAKTPQYQALAAENTLSGLPSSILPSASAVTAVRTAIAGGQKVYVMDWTTTATGSGTAISVRLTLTATPRVLPVSETLTTRGEAKTVSFGRWGAPFTVGVPTSVIPYAQVTG